jgi:hypothetical protein
MTDKLNLEGLTFEEWLAAAFIDYGAQCERDQRLIREGWNRGQDPTEWRAHGAEECCHELHHELSKEGEDDQTAPEE